MNILNWPHEPRLRLDVLPLDKGRLQSLHLIMSDIGDAEELRHRGFVAYVLLEIVADLRRDAHHLLVHQVVHAVRRVLY